MAAVDNAVTLAKEARECRQRIEAVERDLQEWRLKLTRCQSRERTANSRMAELSHLADGKCAALVRDAESRFRPTYGLCHKSAKDGRFCGIHQRVMERESANKEKCARFYAKDTNA
jgi:hypothetical protein